MIHSISSICVIIYDSGFHSLIQSIQIFNLITKDFSLRKIINLQFDYFILGCKILALFKNKFQYKLVFRKRDWIHKLHAVKFDLPFFLCFLDFLRHYEFFGCHFFVFIGIMLFFFIFLLLFFWLSF